MSRGRDLLGHPGGVLAIVRLAAVPVFLAAERLVDHPVANSAPFSPLLALTGAYAALALLAELRGRPLASARVLAAADVALITALVATSGGPFSQLRHAFFLLPVGAALLLRPALTAVASAVCVGLYAAIALTYPDPTLVRPDAVGFEATQLLFLAWMGAAATLLSAVLHRRSAEIGALAASRGKLVAQALEAEDRARRRLAEALHDEALQNLLAARQLLAAEDPESTALARQGIDEAVAQIRQEVFDLHPHLLEQAGLRAALQAVAERAGRRAGFAVRVVAEEEAEGRQDGLVFSVARELVANAAKHSGATTVDVRVRVAGDALELTVADDGRGIDPAQVRAAQSEGHIGLASCSERAEAVGGELTVRTGDAGRGTVARLRVPLPPPAIVPPPIGASAAPRHAPGGGSRAAAPSATMEP